VTAWRGIPLGLLASVAFPLGALAQSALEQTPNMHVPWQVAGGTAAFVVEHRFEFLEGPGALVNFPTMTLAAGLPAGVVLGLRYATNSEIVPEALGSDELELWLGRDLWRGERLGVGAQAAYNRRASSADGALTGWWGTGPFRVIAEGRVHSDLFGAGDAGASGTVGALLRLTPHLQIGGDVGRAFTDLEGVSPVWSGGIALRIPASPHTLALYATNGGTTSLQGAARPGVIGLGGTRWGFSFNMPITPRRWAAIVRPERAPRESEGARPDTVVVAMTDFVYSSAEIRVSPGQTVEWRNDDPVEHTVTAEDGSWGSGLVGDGEVYRRTFDHAGRYPYFCEPHPFMRGVVVVAEP